MRDKSIAMANVTALVSGSIMNCKDRLKESGRQAKRKGMEDMRQLRKSMKVSSKMEGMVMALPFGLAVATAIKDNS